MQKKIVFIFFIYFTMTVYSVAHDKRDTFLDRLQYNSFLYFWELSNDNGLTPDRAPTPSFSSIAAVGFGLSSYICGVERKYITRDQAVNRTLTTLKFLWKAPQGSSSIGCAGYKGFFYHFLDMKKGDRFKHVELSTIDTALLMAGILSCYSYYNKDNEQEQQIRKYALSLYSRVNWQWFQARKPLLCLGWTPEKGFLPYDWKGYNEAMILYILALGSPTYPIEKNSWHIWTNTYRWGKFYDKSHINFAPLFGHQYSHIWIDFRGIQDEYMRQKGIDYFENSRRAVYSNRAYCILNPDKWSGYSSTIWGLTACDGPEDRTIFIGKKKRSFFLIGQEEPAILKLLMMVQLLQLQQVVLSLFHRKFVFQL